MSVSHEHNWRSESNWFVDVEAKTLDREQSCRCGARILVRVEGTNVLWFEGRKPYEPKNSSEDGCISDMDHLWVQGVVRKWCSTCGVQDYV